MARFMAGCKGQRGEVTRLGGTSSGATAFCRGWDAGVKIDASGDECAGITFEDSFSVCMNGGSNGAADTVCLGVVVSTEQGPVFKPSEYTKKLVLERLKNA